MHSLFVPTCSQNPVAPPTRALPRLSPLSATQISDFFSSLSPDIYRRKKYPPAGRFFAYLGNSPRRTQDGSIPEIAREEFVSLTPKKPFLSRASALLFIGGTEPLFFSLPQRVKNPPLKRSCPPPNPSVTSITDKSTRSSENGTNLKFVLERAFSLLAHLSAPLFAFLQAAPPSLAEHKITSIFNPLATPAKTEFNMGMLEFAITGAIFAVVAGLLVYTMIRFRQRRHDDGRQEPPQIYGSNQIEAAWTVIPILIVFVIAGVSARSVWGVEDASHLKTPSMSPSSAISFGGRSVIPSSTSSPPMRFTSPSRTTASTPPISN